MFPPLPLMVPTIGKISISAMQLNVRAVLDIQKTLNDTPYMRVVSCRLENGVVSARAENIGLLTDLANLKYQVWSGMINISK